MNIFERLASTLSDEELTDMSIAAAKENANRITVRVQRGDFPTPTDKELTSWRNNDRVDAIKAYMDRMSNNGVSISTMEARAVMMFTP